MYMKNILKSEIERLSVVSSRSLGVEKDIYPLHFHNLIVSSYSVLVVHTSSSTPNTAPCLLGLDRIAERARHHPGHIPLHRPHRDAHRKA